MAVKTIVHFEIPADDVNRLSRFYKEVFGWKFDLAPMPEMQYWLITTGPAGKSVGGGMYKKMHPRDGPRNFIVVEEIDRVIAAFKKAGGSSSSRRWRSPASGSPSSGRTPRAT